MLPEARPSIKRIGFFHFGNFDKSSAVYSLERALDRTELKGRLNHSLIVLPEGFNVVGGYYSAVPTLDAPTKSELQRLSVNRGISFVVGLKAN